MAESSAGATASRLVVGAHLGRLVVAPAHEPGGVAEAAGQHVLVAHLDGALDPQGSHDRSLVAFQRLSPPGIQVVPSCAIATAHSRQGWPSIA